MIVEWDELKDELIQDFCNDRCPTAVGDYHCPDHNCPVWRTLTFSIQESMNDDCPEVGEEK